MKRIFIFVGLLFTLSSFTFSPAVNAAFSENGPQKKVQRVKVMIKKDGKTTSIDTTFNLTDEKAIQVKVDSILKNIEIEGVEDGKSEVVLHKGPKAVRITKATGNMSGDQQFDIFIQSDDSIGKDKEKRILFWGDNGKMKISADMDTNGLVPPPPPPPVPAFPGVDHSYFQYQADPFSFDTKDSSIISYEKKDMGKGLEKITIIRKKRSNNDLKKEVEVNVNVEDTQKK